jgi:hypothetical protein
MVDSSEEGDRETPRKIIIKGIKNVSGEVSENN